MLFNSVSVIYSLVDSFFVGKLGELQVGAISVISNINMCGTAFVTGLSAAGISLLSKAVGAGDMKKGNQMATILLEISIIISLVIAIILWMIIDIKTPRLIQFNYSSADFAA